MTVSNNGDWRVSLIGECMVSRPFSMHEEPEFLGMWDLVKDSDVAYGHLEMNFAELEELSWPARGQGIGSFMLADPQVANDLKWAGLDLMSTAHNHSFDFGAEGLTATNRHMKSAGIATAGTGTDLERATEPCFVEKKKGRVSLVATSSGNQHFMWANHAKGGLKARPGVNPQRLTYEFMLDSETMQNVKDFAKKLNLIKAPKHGPEGAFGVQIPGAQQWGDPECFVEGDRCEIISKCDPRDLARNMRAIEEARCMSDLVIVAHHFSVSDGPRGDIPPRFVEEFAHAAIDGGADMYVGHGWHRTLGIEIYKGKPIIYGIGNFWANSEFLQRVPYDSYEAWGHDMDRLHTLHSALHPLHPGLDHSGETWWGSCILQVEMVENKLRRLILHPVEMGRDSTPEAKLRRRTGKGEHPLTEGRPMLASGDNAQRILERYQMLSAAYGTKIDIDNGIGVIEV